MKTQNPAYRTFRLFATAAILVFMFIEELILKPLRKIKIAVLEKTIKRMNGYVTIGVLVGLKTIEGLCKVVLPFASSIGEFMGVSSATVVMGIVVIDGVLGFISMNLIIHGHENLKEFSWYVRFVTWVGKLKDDVKATNFYKSAHSKVTEIKATVKEWWGDVVFKVFGKRNPRGLFRYIRTAVYLKYRKMRA